MKPQEGDERRLPLPEVDTAVGDLLGGPIRRNPANPTKARWAARLSFRLILLRSLPLSDASGPTGPATYVRQGDTAAGRQGGFGMPPGPAS